MVIYEFFNEIWRGIGEYLTKWGSKFVEWVKSRWARVSRDVNISPTTTIKLADRKVDGLSEEHTTKLKKYGLSLPHNKEEWTAEILVNFFTDFSDSGNKLSPTTLKKEIYDEHKDRIDTILIMGFDSIFPTEYKDHYLVDLFFQGCLNIPPKQTIGEPWKLLERVEGNVRDCKLRIPDCPDYLSRAAVYMIKALSERKYAVNASTRAQAVIAQIRPEI